MERRYLLRTTPVMRPPSMVGAGSRRWASAWRSKSLAAQGLVVQGVYCYFTSSQDTTATSAGSAPEAGLYNHGWHSG